MKYVALLRGINVGGNNKISMHELKSCFEHLGFEHVTTYINSGNVLFDYPDTAIEILNSQCERAIKATFGLHIVCAVIDAPTYINALSHAPEWWGTATNDRHNAIFVIPPYTSTQVMNEAGESKPEYERVDHHGPVIFWSAPRETFAMTRYSKVISTKASKYITIRNANTAQKILSLLQQ